MLNIQAKCSFTPIPDVNANALMTDTATRTVIQTQTQIDETCIQVTIQKEPNASTGISMKYKGSTAAAAAAVVVTKTGPDSPFVATHLKPGFELVEINGHSNFNSAQEAADYIKESGEVLSILARDPNPWKYYRAKVFWIVERWAVGHLSRWTLEQHAGRFSAPHFV